MHYQCTHPVETASMETDLTNVRRWLFEDFKARCSLFIPTLLEANPEMGAFDLMAAVEAAETPLPLGPDRRAYLLDQYLVARWAGETGPAPAPVRRRPRKPVSPATRRTVPV